MNKKGGLFVISWIFVVILFIIIWAQWLGSEINYWATRYIANNSPSGFEAFLISNLNLWIFVWLVIATIFVLYGGRD